MKKKISLKDKKNFLKSIKDAIPKHCSNCGTKYTESDLNLVKQDDYTAMLHLTCSKCKEAYLINVVSPLGTLKGSSRVPLKVDITTAGEAKKFIGDEAITSDDVLNAHEVLESIKSGEDLEKNFGAQKSKKSKTSPKQS